MVDVTQTTSVAARIQSGSRADGRVLRLKTNAANA